MRPLLAHCRLGLAHVAHHRGKLHDARDHVTAGISMYHDMGMLVWVAGADQLLREVEQAT